MALTRKLWLVGPALGMVIAAIAVLPPRPLPESGYEYYRRRHRDAVESARRRLRERLDGAVAADSLARLADGAGALRSADGLISVVYDRHLTRDSAQRWLEALVNELALVPGAPGAASGVPIVVGFHRDTATWTQVYRHIQGAGTTLHCVVDVRLRNSTARTGSGDGRMAFTTASGARATSLLNWCGLFARFGVPGPALTRWAAMAGLRDDRFGDGYSWSVRSMRETARRRGTPLRLPRYLFRLASCAGGSGPACLRALGLDRTTSNEGRYRWWYGVDFNGVNEPTRAGFLASLLATEPPERFAALWRSDRPIGEALAAAYGRGADTLVLQWARQRFLPSQLEANPYESPFGPTIGMYVAQYSESRGTAFEVLASLAWAVALLGVGAFAAMRRQAA